MQCSPALFVECKRAWFRAANLVLRRHVLLQSPVMSTVTALRFCVATAEAEGKYLSMGNFFRLPFLKNNLSHFSGL